MRLLLREPFRLQLLGRIDGCHSHPLSPPLYYSVFAGAVNGSWLGLAGLTQT